MSAVQELLRLPLATDTGHVASPKRSLMPHPIVMMILIIAAAVLMSWLIPSGLFDRAPNGHVLPGTYHEIPKQLSLGGAAAGRTTARHTSPIPRRSLRHSRPPSRRHDAGRRTDLHDHVPRRHVRRAARVRRARCRHGAPRRRHAAATSICSRRALMIALSAGSTFLGLISEYLVLIPMMLVLAEKLRLGPLFAVALVAIPAKLGYLASVTNPLPLVIAQPIVGVPVFSGAGFRLVMWIVFLAPRHRPTCSTTSGAAALRRPMTSTSPSRYPHATQRCCSPSASASSPSCTAPAICTGAIRSSRRSTSHWQR